MFHHYSNCAAALTDLCHKKVLDNVVHTKVTKVAVDFLKVVRMISALVLQIPKSNIHTKCIVAIDANEIVVVGVLL